MLKEKLGKCSYEENYYEEEIIKIQDDIEVIDKVSNKKSTKKYTKELIEESDKESIEKPENESNKKPTKQFTKKLIEEPTKKLTKESDKELYNESNKEPTKKFTKELIKEPTKKLIEYSDEELDEIFKDFITVKRPNKDKSTTDWYDKNKFNKVLTTIDCNKFNHKNKIGKFKFNDINNLINN